MMQASGTVDYMLYSVLKKKNPQKWGFPGGSVVKKPPANAGHMGSIPVQKDPTCHRATRPECHNYRACTRQPGSHNKKSHCNEKPGHN